MVFGGEIFSGTGILILSAVIILIWVVIEIKRFKHKIFAIFLMILIIFLYFGVIVVFQDRNVDFDSYSGMIDATKIYFSWLSSVFGNFKTMTAGAIQLDWRAVNETSTI
jgi:glucan phosphoethanolaminetransferase (alkaline phosphatase superfamily)|tara:strand:- start:674 stop:1000 length:327 start_codon:yes stop_codon:yes gene_type:complete